MMVSAVIPCFNAKNYIAATLDSIFLSGSKNLEIICIDNNSTDGTYELLLELREQLYPQMTVAQEMRKGAPYARNTGLEMARGEYIQFLDADDLLLPGKIAYQQKIMQDTGADIVAGNYWIRDAGVDAAHDLLHQNKHRDAIYALFTKNLGITSANLYRKGAVVQAGGWNTDMKGSQEYELMFRMLQNNARVAFAPETLTIKIEQPNSISISNKAEAWRRYVELRKQILEYLVLYPECTQITLQDFADTYFNYLRGLARLWPTEADKMHKHFVKNYRNYLIHNRKLSKSYKQLYRLLGFINTEFFYTLISKFKR